MMMFGGKVMGICYFVISLFGGVLGLSFSILMSMELSIPFSLMEEVFYYTCVTTHGFLMLFYFLTTLAMGFNNYLLPQMCFFKDMFYSSLNLFSLGLVVVSLFLVVLSLVLGEGVMTGWTLYVPLSNSMFSTDVSMDLLILGMHVFTLASFMGAVNSMATVSNSYSLFGHVFDINPFMWGVVMTSFLMLLCMPALTCALTFLLLDSSAGTHIFDVEFGGDPMLFQSMFWYFGHPEVYVLMVPVFGVVSHVLESKGFIFNSEGIMSSMMALGLLSFLVFGHHMTTVGWGTDMKSYFMSATVAMSIPTGVKVFSWLFDFYFWDMGNSFIIISVVLFTFHFTLGGITGFFLSNSTLDFFFHDTWFVVGHLHMVLAVSAFLGFLSGMFLMFNNSLGGVKILSSVGVLFNVLLFVFFNSLFIPFHIAGVLGLHSSVSCYPLDMFLVFYTGSVSFLGVLIFMFLMIVSIFFLGMGNNK